MSLAFEVADAFVIVPYLQSSVLSARNEVLSLSGDVNGIQLVVRPFDGSDDLAIELLPVCDLPIRACCQDLVFLGVENGLLEGGGFEQAQQPGSALQVPDDARSVAAGADSLRIVLADLDGPYSASMFLH